MSTVVGQWKHFHAARSGVTWQDGFFDHRIRNAEEFQLKADYIRRNPVVKSLCVRLEDWPWMVDAHSLDPEIKQVAGRSARGHRMP